MPPLKKYKKGDVIKSVVQGIDYVTPPMPDPSTIRGAHLPVSEQVWYRRTEYLQWDWNIETDYKDPNRKLLWHEAPAPGQMEWYEEEIERLNTGDWIMINGVPTFFNKYCYFFHAHFVLLTEQIYPTYKETSLEYFTFYKLCEDDPLCLGDLGIKGRRVGLSSMAAAIDLLIGIIEDNTLQGIVSKTGDDAQEMYFMIKNGLENLPLFLVPELNKVTDSEIHIAKQAKRISANNRTINADKGKNNRINWLDTSENAYDGRKARRIILDEAAKWVKVAVQVCLSKISEVLVVGASVSGHISVFSTVNKGDKGGDAFRAIWDGSDHVSGKKDMFGRTQTKLKRFFIAGFRGLNGYVGKYGESIIETPTKSQTEYLKTYIDPATGRLACPNPHIGAKAFLNESRIMLAHDEELHAEQVRMYPFEWKEVFKGTNNTCYFNREELVDQIETISAELKKTQKKENGRRVKFNKEEKNAPVTIQDDSGGFWWVLDVPKEKNKRVFVNGVRCPDNCTYGVAGMDPIATVKNTIDKGSDACIIIHKRFDANDPENSGMPVAMFIGRPKTKKIFHEQLYWGLEFYGIKVLGEAAPSDWIDYAIDNSLCSPQDYIKKHGYLITIPRSNKSEDYGAPPQNKDITEQHITEMKEYAEFNMHKIKFLRLLNDMLGFDVKERTVYDACMAWGYALIGLKATYIKPVEVKKIKKFIEIKRSKKYY